MENKEREMGIWLIYDERVLVFDINNGNCRKICGFKGDQNNLAKAVAN